MSTTQVTTWRKYTQAEKQEYRARMRRREITAYMREKAAEIHRHYFADNFGSRVPTACVNGDIL